MANGFGSMTLTTKGKNLLAKAQTGTTLAFTRVAIGSGAIGDTDVSALNSLIAQEMSLSISDYINNGSTATICTTLSNSNLTTGFYWKEIGLFATDPSLGEILYGYASAGDGEIFIPAAATSAFESACNVTINISNASSVTATIDSSLVYATQKDISNIKDGTTVVAKATAAGTATKLATARTISATGDATGSTSFDGSTDTSMALTLAASGVAAGTYKSVTVDAKGRVTTGTNPTTTAGYGITDAASNVASCSNTEITSASQTTVLTYTPSAQGNFNINTYVRDVTAATTIDIELTYTDGGGAQTVEIFNGSAPVGSNMLPPYFFNAAVAAITLKITAGTANQVYVSAVLEGY